MSKSQFNNQRVAPSTIRADLGRPNPMFDRMLHVVDVREKFRIIANKISQLSNKYRDPSGALVNSVDMALLAHDPEFLALQAEYIKLRKEMDSVPDTQNVLPDPPKREVLYNRIEKGSDVVDIGGGNKEKNSQLQGIKSHLNVTNIDPEVPQQEPNSPLNTVENNETIVINAETTVSFNSFTQLNDKEQEMVLNTDGIHICPDLEELELEGICHPSPTEEYIVHSVTKTGVQYCDRKCKTETGGYKIRQGYKAFNTYRERQIELRYNSEMRKGKCFTPQAVAEDLMFSDDVTFKNDGHAYRIECVGGKTRITGRNGDFYEGSCQKNIRMILTAEMIENPRNPNFNLLILHRVNLFGKFVPFHSGSCLRHFAKRVRIKVFLNGKTYFVEGPQSFRQTEKYSKKNKPNTYKNPENPEEEFVVKTDGIITRSDEKDYYNKSVWTFETDDPDALVEKLEKYGIEATNEPGQYGQPQEIVQHGWDDTIHEFSVATCGIGKVKIKYNRPRPDRIAPDSLDKILWRIQRAS